MLQLLREVCILHILQCSLTQLLVRQTTLLPPSDKKNSLHFNCTCRRFLNKNCGNAQVLLVATRAHWSERVLLEQLLAARVAEESYWNTVSSSVT